MDDGGEERGLPGEEAQLAEEAPRAVDGDQALVVAFPLDDGHLALQDDDEGVILGALAEQDLARRRRPRASHRPEAREMLVVEPWVGAVVVGRLGQRGRGDGARAYLRCAVARPRPAARAA